MELVIKKAKYRESCQDVRGFNTMIRLYWSDAFGFTLLSQQQPLLIFWCLLFSVSIFITLNIHPVINYYLKTTCFKIFDFWESKVRWSFPKLIIFGICNISAISGDASALIVPDSPPLLTVILMKPTQSSRQEKKGHHIDCPCRWAVWVQTFHGRSVSVPRVVKKMC